MYLRLEMRGYYLEVGRTTTGEDVEPGADADPPAVVDSQYPMAEPVQRTGFRHLGQDGWLVDGG